MDVLYIHTHRRKKRLLKKEREGELFICRNRFFPPFISFFKGIFSLFHFFFATSSTVVQYKKFPPGFARHAWTAHSFSRGTDWEQNSSNEKIPCFLFHLCDNFYLQRQRRSMSPNSCCSSSSWGDKVQKMTIFGQLK